MKILADENIPLVNELFGHLGTVKTRAGRSISSEDVVDADVLLVRSVTVVNEALLAGSRVKFVGTCTIGTDHLDQRYLTEHDITYASAPGCNALGVVQYVFSALAQLNQLEASLKVGIVGCGNVGGRLYKAMRAAGYDCICYDPFLSNEIIPDLHSWESLSDCDVVCVHTPLTYDGEYPTFHMIGKHFLSQMKPGALLLNAGRGAVVDNQALLAHLQSANTNNIRVVLDVWEPEPHLNTDLLQRVSLGTPHIAGYSYEGKVNGSLMIYQSLAQWLGLPTTEINQRLMDVKSRAFGDPISLYATSISNTVLKTYPIKEDDHHLRAVSQNIGVEFDLLRKHYPQRREFGHYKVSHTGENDRDFLAALGFVLDQ